MPFLHLTLWNVEWAKPGTERGQLVAARLFAEAPDVVCVAEGYPAMLGHAGHAILADADHGYQTTDGRRKVMLWSRNPWAMVDFGCEGGFPPGRLVSGMTETPVGLIRFIAACIPWKSAHVTTGHRNRASWQDHIHFLDALARWLKPSNVPTVLLGDFNQRIPRVAQPVEVYERLSSVLRPTLRVVTPGSVAGAEAPLIDHIAVSGELEPVEVRAFSATGEGGVKLSDHPGIRARFSSSNGAFGLGAA